MRGASFECAGCTSRNSIEIDPEEGEYQQRVVPCQNCGRDNILEISIDPETNRICIIAELE